jgi:hypothetical protein
MALTQDPQTGKYVDPQSGQVFHDPSGTQLSTDPGLNSQVQRNLGISNQLYSSLGQYGQGFQQAQAGQNQLGSYLQQVINGSAPSVASNQLQQGLGQIRSDVNSQVSGATGNNAALARYGGEQAYGNAAAQANQAAALNRTQEVNAAEAAKGQLYNQQAGQNAQMFGQTLSGAGQASGTANSGAQAQAQIDQQNRAMWLQFIGNMAGAAGGIGAKFATGGAAPGATAGNPYAAAGAASYGA